MGGISKKFYAHELLRFDFKNILQEAKRQEEIDTRIKMKFNLHRLSLISFLTL